MTSTGRRHIPGPTEGAVIPPGPSPVDLHAHTTRSDGILEPTGLVAAAHEAGVRTFAPIIGSARSLLGRIYPDDVHDDTHEPEFIERMIPIYDKHFSHNEIKAWIAFVETPLVVAQGSAVLIPGLSRFRKQSRR